MSEPYRVFIGEEPLQLLISIPKSKRGTLLVFLNSLSKDPFNEGDFSETDARGRTCFCKIIDDLAISFYPDHASKEIKVFEISFADA